MSRAGNDPDLLKRLQHLHNELLRAQGGEQICSFVQIGIIVVLMDLRVIVLTWF